MFLISHISFIHGIYITALPDISGKFPQFFRNHVILIDAAIYHKIEHIIIAQICKPAQFLLQNLIGGIDRNINQFFQPLFFLIIAVHKQSDSAFICPAVHISADQKRNITAVFYLQHPDVIQLLLPQHALHGTVCSGEHRGNRIVYHTVAIKRTVPKKRHHRVIRIRIKLHLIR